MMNLFRNFGVRLGLIFALSLVGLAGTSYAGSVHSCKTTYKKTKKSEDLLKVTRCVLEISEGKVGDVVEVKNQYNYIVATGKIVKRKGRYALVILNKIVKEVKTGYPVIVRNNDSIDYWTATTPWF